MENYHTKAEAIIGLQQKGYDLDFILNNENLVCVQDSELINPDDFDIVETHRFTSAFIKDEFYIIYAIASFQNGIKGILMTSYSSFRQGLSIHLWSKLSVGLS